MQFQLLIRGGLSLLAVVLLFAAILWTDSASVRYSKYQCHYAMIYQQSDPIDIAFIGSSRSVQGVGTEEIVDVIGSDIDVRSFAKSWRGQGINYTIMRDLLEQRHVKTMLVEVNMPETGTFHGHFFLVGRLSDWLMSQRFRNKYLLDLEALGKTSKNMIDRFTEQWTLALLGALPQFDNAHLQVALDQRECRSKEEKRREQAYWDQKLDYYQTYYVDKTWEWGLDEKRARHDTGFLRAIKALTDENDVELIFYHMPEALNLTLNPEFAQEFEAEIGAPLIIPPAQLTRDVEAMFGFADATHMTQRGRAFYSTWLANRIIQTSDRL
ncbi:MAG: hypothetical protein ABJQ55_01320 [Hyphomicrobiales bacterium]